MVGSACCASAAEATNRLSVAKDAPVRRRERRVMTIFLGADWIDAYGKRAAALASERADYGLGSC
jgi:hypothetical protein